MAKMKSFSEYLNPVPSPQTINEDVMKPSLGSSKAITDQSNFMESFSKNYEAFTQNVEKAELFIEKFNELAESVKPNENLIERGEVETILATHLLIINQNIQDIKKDLLGINESDLSKITDAISSIDSRTETLIDFVQAELPKNKNKLYELSLNLDKKVALLSADISDVEETTAATFESVSRKLAEAEAATEEQFKLSDEVKLKILAKVNALYEDLHTTNDNIGLLSENYDEVLLPAIARINAFEENLSSVGTTVNDYYSKLDETKEEYFASLVQTKEELKQVINEVNAIFVNEKYVELDRKVERIEEIFDSINAAQTLNEELGILTPEELKTKTVEEVEKYLSGKTFQQPNPEMVSTSPEFKNIAQKLKFLEQAIGRIAATGPGGGEVNLRYLDDIDGASIQDGRYLKYDAATKKFVFSAITGAVVVDTLLANESVSIATNKTPAVFIKDNNLTSWDYSGKSISISAQELTATGIFFKSDGTEMYIIGTTGDDVNQYTLSTAWDVTTATFTRVSATVGETNPSGVFFKPDGTVMYITGTTNDTVREFSVSTAWDVSTITFVRDFSVGAQDTGPNDLWFKPDGTKMYFVGSTNDRVYEYNLSTAWNVSTAVFLQFFSVGSQDTTPASVNFNSDGTRMYVLGATGLDINRYSLSTPWDISTAVFFNNFYIGFQETAPNGLFINLDAGFVYVVGLTGDTVFQYDTLTDGLALLSNTGLFIEGSLYTNSNLIVTSNARIDGSLSVSGTISGVVAAVTLSATSTINLAGATNSVTSLGTTATTGTTTVGGLLQTGAITVGQSTSAQTLNLGTGATLTATTKAINIGTGGVSGSTTNITVGSNVSGATNLTTMYGPVQMGLASASLFALDVGQTANDATIRSFSSGAGAWFMAYSTAGYYAGVKHVGGGGTRSWFSGMGNGLQPYTISMSSDGASNRFFTVDTTGVISLGNIPGNESLRVTPVVSAANFLEVKGAASTNFPGLYANGSDSNVNIGYFAKNDGYHFFYGSNSAQFAVLPTGNAINYVGVTGGATTVAPTVSAQGQEANISLKLSPKGTGNVTIVPTGGYLNTLQFSQGYYNTLSYIGVTGTGGFAGVQYNATPATGGVNHSFTAYGSPSSFGQTLFSIGSVPAGGTSVNYLSVTPNITGNAPVFSATGTDTNVGLDITTKGFGVVNVNTGTGTIAKFQDRGVTTVNSPFIFRAGLAGTASGTLTFPVSPNLQTPDPSDFTFNTNSGTAGGQAGSTQVVIGHTTSSVNYVKLTGSGTNGGVLANAAPTISVLGSDTNINLVLAPKGTGNVATNSPILTGSTVTANGGFNIGSGASPHYMYSGSATLLSFRVGTSPSYFSFEDNAGAIGLSTGNPFYFKGWAGTYTFAIAGPVNANAVNYLTVGTSVTGAGPTLYPNGSDTNISLSLQPKGSGAINFVTGSKVNLGLGNSVTGIKIGQSGVGYTSFPTVVIAAPNAPSGGTQAVASAIGSMKNVTATVVSGGTGYAVGNTLTIVGGVIQISAGTMTVTSISAGGVITGVNIVNFAPYGAPLQANPVTTTVSPAGGTGATFNIGYGIYSGTVGLATAGSGYVEQPAISFTGGGSPSTVATGFATVGSIPTVNTLGSALSFTTPSGEQFRVNDSNAPAANYMQVTGGATGISPGFATAGTDAAVGLSFSTKSTGNMQFTSGGYSNTMLLLQSITSSVNYLNVRPSITNFPVTLNANGSDTNTGIAIISKGTGAIDLAAGSSGINISNGSSVTSVPVTVQATSAYSTVPTVSFSAPTTPGGVNAVGNALMGIWGYSPVSGGTGYSVNDILTIVGGTVYNFPLQLKVTSVNLGVITGTSVYNWGSYSAIPTGTIATTVLPTGGTGATFTATWCVYSVNISTAGSGYVEQPTVTFSGTGGAVAHANIGSGTTVKSLGSSMNLQTANGQTFLQVLDDTSAPNSVSGLYIVGAASGLGRVGLRSNKALYLGTTGGNPFGFFTNTSSTSDGIQQFAITSTANSVNWLSVSASVTGQVPTLSSVGSDTNIGLNLSAKGSGSINAITNGGVVNLSNGSGLTGVVRTGGGGNYTAAITATVSAPTTPGGVTATVTAYSAATAFPIVSGGTGYSVNDILTVVGGTGIGAQSFTVTSVNLGVITGVSILSYGQYTVLPPSAPATTTVVPTGGTGATLNLSSWSMSSIAVATAGSGYVETPTITITGAGTGASAYALIGSSTTLKTIGSNLILSTASGPQVYISDNGGITTDYVYLGGSYFGRPGVGAKSITGSGNASLMMFAQGTGGTIQFATNNSAQKQVEILHKASAVNFLTMTGAATTASPVLSVGGSDTNISLDILAKNNGSVSIQNGNGQAARFYGGTNYLAIAGNPTGTAPEISVQGTEANIDLKLTPKGTGVLNITATATPAAAVASTHKIPVKINGTIYYILVSNV